MGNLTKGLLAILFVLAYGAYLAFKKFLVHKNAEKLEDWAKKNGLKFQKKVKLGFFRSENIALFDLIWGLYKEKRIYFFRVANNEGRYAQASYYLNGNFYRELEPEDVDKLLENKNYLEIVRDFEEWETEMIQVLVAQAFLDKGVEIDYRLAKKIFKLLRKFYRSKVGLKDRITKNLKGSFLKAGVKFNSSEAINFVSDNDNSINLDTIRTIGEAYENIITNFNAETAEKIETSVEASKK